MHKRNTVELDDAEDLIDDTLVSEELEKFEQESLEALSRGSTRASAGRAAGTVQAAGAGVGATTPVGAAGIGNTAPNVESRTLVSRQTQTVAPPTPLLHAPTNPASLRRAASSIQLIQNVKNVRTLTRQLRTGGRRQTVKKLALPKPDVVEEEEEEEDDFYKIEAGTSNSRKTATLTANLDGSSHKGTVGTKLGHRFRNLNKSLSRTFTVARLRPARKQSTRDRVRRDNVRAKLNWFQLVMHDLKLAIERQKNERNEFKLFLKTIKSIQGELGSSTAALFLFVRYLLMINIFSSIVWVGFVVVPQAYKFDYATLREGDDVFASIQLFLGTGRVAESWLFFKGYSESFGSPKYLMYVAYIVVHFVSIVGVFFGILKTIGTDIVREGSDSGYQEKSLAMNLFGGWDYSINSQEAIKKQKKSTRSNFKDLLCELTSAQRTRSVREMRIIYSLRTLAWFIWLLLVAGAIAAIVYIIRQSNNTEGTEFVTVYGPTIALSAINIAVPFLMQQLTLIENYDVGRTEQYVTISRVYVMRMISLCTFIITLIRESTGEDCPQLYWGQEFYKLCIINTVSNTATLLKYPAFLYLLDKRVEVDLPSSLMSLIYFQGCIWFGNLFCPLLSLMAVISNLVYFGVGSVMIKKCCQPPTKRYNSQNSKFFNSFLALTITIMMAITCYIIVQQQVDCGPYSRGRFNVMWDAFSELSSTWSVSITRVVGTIASAAVAVPAIFCLVVWIWFLQIQNSKTGLRNELITSELLMLREEKAKHLKEKRHSPTN